MHGPVENKNKKAPSRITHSGPPLQVRTPESYGMASVCEASKRSIRRCSAEFGTPREFVRRMLKYDINIKPHMIEMH